MSLTITANAAKDHIYAKIFNTPRTSLEGIKNYISLKPSPNDFAHYHLTRRSKKSQLLLQSRSSPHVVVDIYLKATNILTYEELISTVMEVERLTGCKAYIQPYLIFNNTEVSKMLTCLKVITLTELDSILTKLLV